MLFRSEELLALDEALQKLAAVEPIKAKLVELRYFAGLTGEQVAEVLGISPTTADRHWAYARAWLYDHLHTAESSPSQQGDAIQPQRGDRQ